MATKDPSALLARLLTERGENAWLEFKENNDDPDEIARCVSSLANAAILADKDRAFLVFGIQDRTRAKLGTTVRLNELKKGGESFTNWLSRMVEPRLLMEFLDFEADGRQYAILTVEPTYER